MAALPRFPCSTAIPQWVKAMNRPWAGQRQRGRCSIASAPSLCPSGACATTFIGRLPGETGGTVEHCGLR